MKITKFDNALQLILYPMLFPINCYLVIEKDGLTLVDTAMKGAVNGIVAEAKKLSLPITRIVLTHAHGDHIGGLDALVKVYPEAEVFISQRELRILHGDKTTEVNEANVPIKGGYAPVQLNTFQIISEGDRLGSLQVIETPGHTPGHLAFLDTRDHFIFAGDALQTRAGVAVAGIVRSFFPFPALGTWHLPTALASAEKLLALEPKYLAVGHGPVLNNPGGNMKKAIEEAKRKVIH